MEALGHWPKEPAAPNLPVTAQVHAGSPDSLADASPQPGVPHLVALPARTARDYPRIVHARSWVESFAQGQQTYANAALYGSKRLAGLPRNLGMSEPFEETHFQSRTFHTRQPTPGASTSIDPSSRFVAAHH